MKNDAIMQAIAEEISSYYTEEGKFRDAVVENPLDVVLTFVPIGQALRGVNIAGKA